MATTSSVSTSSSTSYISGTISGLDTDALIEAAVAQKTARADTIDLKVTGNEAKVTAYETLQDLLTAITDSMSSLKSTTYSALSTDSAANAFDAKQAFLTASDGAEATDILAVSAESSATAASYAITVEQLARAMKVASSAQDKTAALGQAGDLTLGVTDGAAATIAVTADMTLEDLAAAINAQTSTTGVAATLLKVATDSYQLVLSAADTDVDIQISDTSGAALAIGLTDADGAFTTVLQEPQPAIVTIDGVEVTSASNELTDTLTGLSISLLQETEDGQTVTLDIEADYEDIKTAITGFIDAYNALREFVVTQQTVGSGGVVAEDAVLFADSILRSLTKQLSTLIGGEVASADDTVAALADMGVTLNGSNQLELSDETALDNLLLTGLDSLASFFETRFTSSDSGLKLLKNDTSASFDFTLDVTVADGVLTDATIDGQSGLFTVSGSRLVGAEGSIYEGLSFAYAGTASASISVELAQGFANQIATLLGGYADTTTGVIARQITSLETADTAWTTKADKIRDDAETYRARLVAKYAAMETELYAAQVLQQQIQAILGSTSDDDS